MQTINPQQFPVLKTERLILRQPVNGDAKAICDLRSDEDVNRYIERPKDSSIEKALAFIEKVNNNFKQNTGYYWAICLKDDPKLIGTACLWNFTDDKTAEIGYELKPDYQGHGFMNEALQSVLDFSFNVLGLKRLDAFVHRENLKSIRLLERNKFILDTERKDEENSNLNIYILFK